MPVDSDSFPFYECLKMTALKVEKEMEMGRPYRNPGFWGDLLEDVLQNPAKIVRNLWLQAMATGMVVCEYWL